MSGIPRFDTMETSRARAGSGMQLPSGFEKVGTVSTARTPWRSMRRSSSSRSMPVSGRQGTSTTLSPIASMTCNVP